MSNKNKSAFPVSEEGARGQVAGLYGGLTKREMFAAMAMHGMLGSDPNDGRMICERESIARMAVRRADELIKELEKTGTDG